MIKNFPHPCFWSNEKGLKKTLLGTETIWRQPDAVAAETSDEHRKPYNHNLKLEEQQQVSKAKMKKLF